MIFSAAVSVRHQDLAVVTDSRGAGSNGRCFSESLTKRIEAVLVLGSYAASVLVLVFGFARGARRRRLRAALKT